MAVLQSPLVSMRMKTKRGLPEFTVSLRLQLGTASAMCPILTSVLHFRGFALLLIAQLLELMLNSLKGVYVLQKDDFIYNR